uniref:Pectinesterase n=1 Tax=Oryza brachyantha TaxID=4533 RepID=J3N6D3_ORYBR
MFQLDTVSPGDADVVVAKDGTGHFCTVGEALNAAAKRSNGGRRTVVYVKAGVYGENVEVWTSNLVLVGDGIGRTVITGSRSVRQGYTTFSSATFAVNADGFVACGVTFRNTAGAGAEQAVALRASGDRLAFYRCSFEGHQDTLYAHTLRHFYRDTSGRVRWGGYHVITDPSEASEFTAGDLVNAGSWLGSTGVPFTPGL